MKVAQVIKSWDNDKVQLLILWQIQEEGIWQEAVSWAITDPRGLPKKPAVVISAFDIRYNFSPSQGSTENLDYFWNKREKKSDIFPAQI